MPAYRLARWLMRNEHDAEDALQEASLRALRYFRTFTGGNGRAWFLRIVRNTCRGSYAHRWHTRTDPFDEGQHRSPTAVPDPETLLLRSDGAALVARALCDLPERSRALLVHRELEGLSYQELADRMGIPLGTVMSSLSRARQALRGAIEKRLTPPPREAREGDVGAAKGGQKRNTRRSVEVRHGAVTNGASLALQEAGMGSLRVISAIDGGAGAPPASQGLIATGPQGHQ